MSLAVPTSAASAAPALGDPTAVALAEAAKAREQGNAMYSRESYEAAAASYTRGIEVLGGTSTGSPATARVAASRLLCNRAAARLAGGDVPAALEDSRAAAQLDPDSTRARTRWALCGLLSGSADEASAALGAAPSPRIGSSPQPLPARVGREGAEHAELLARIEATRALLEPSEDPDGSRALEGLVRRLLDFLLDDGDAEGARGAGVEAGDVGSREGAPPAATDAVALLLDIKGLCAASGAARAAFWRLEAWRPTLAVAALPGGAAPTAERALRAAAASSEVPGLVHFPHRLVRRLGQVSAQPGAPSRALALRLLSWAAAKDPWLAREALGRDPAARSAGPSALAAMAAELEGGAAATAAVAGGIRGGTSATAAQGGLAGTLAADPRVFLAAWRAACALTAATAKARAAPVTAREQRPLAALLEAARAAGSWGVVGGGGEPGGREGGEAGGGGGDGRAAGGASLPATPDEAERLALEKLRARRAAIFNPVAASCQREALEAFRDLASTCPAIARLELSAERGGASGRRTSLAGSLAALVVDLEAASPRRAVPVRDGHFQTTSYRERRILADYRDNPAGDFLATLDLGDPAGKGRWRGSAVAVDPWEEDEGDPPRAADDGESAGGRSGRGVAAPGPPRDGARLARTGGVDAHLPARTASVSVLEAAARALAALVRGRPAAARAAAEAGALDAADALAGYDPGCVGPSLAGELGGAIASASGALADDASRRSLRLLSELARGGWGPPRGDGGREVAEDEGVRVARARLASLAAAARFRDALADKLPAASEDDLAFVCRWPGSAALAVAEDALSPTPETPAVGGEIPGVDPTRVIGAWRESSRGLLERLLERQRRAQGLGRPAWPQGGCWAALARVRGARQALLSDSWGAEVPGGGAVGALARPPMKPGFLPAPALGVEVGGGGASRAVRGPRLDRAVSEGAMEAGRAPEGGEVGREAGRPVDKAKAAERIALAGGLGPGRGGGGEGGHPGGVGRASGGHGDPDEDAASRGSGSESDSDLPELSDVFDSSPAPGIRQARRRWLALPPASRVSWSQTSQDVSITFCVPAGTKAEEISLSFGPAPAGPSPTATRAGEGRPAAVAAGAGAPPLAPTMLTVRLAWYGSLTSGELGGAALPPPASSWTLSGEELEVNLAKARPGSWWRRARACDEERGYRQLLVDAVQADEPVVPWERMSDEARELAEAIRERQDLLASGDLDIHGFDDFRVVVGENTL